jgi:hypothetical protein
VPTTLLLSENTGKSGAIPLGFVTGNRIDIDSTY